MAYFWRFLKHFCTQEVSMTKKNTRSCSHKRIKAALCAAMCSALTAMPAFATNGNNAAATTGTTVWTKASEIMQDVYSQIISISTVTAVVCAAVALLLMNFSKNGKTVDDSRAWLKRIAITWAILNGLGFIMAYVTPFFHRPYLRPTESCDGSPHRIRWIRTWRKSCQIGRAHV